MYKLIFFPVLLNCLFPDMQLLCRFQDHCKDENHFGLLLITFIFIEIVFIGL